MAQDRYKLKLTALKFISAVDMPAQETAKAVLLKRADATSSVKATARVVKTSDELGLVFGWAFTHAADGADYYDVHGHNILEDDVIKVAADFLAAGGDTDEMHDRSPDGKVVFAMPMTTEVAKSFGITTDTTGLMIAIKPSPTVFAKFKSGELTGFSIDGEGLETKIAKRTEAVRFAKAMLLLECEAGHTHFLDDQGGAASGYTSGESMPQAFSPNGYGAYHSHPWLRENGVIRIGMAEGHCHEIPTAADAAEDIMAEKAIGKSSPSRDVRSVTTMTEADFNKRLTAISKSLVGMSPDHFAYAKSLSVDDVEVFVTKTVAEREVIVKAADAADPVAYTTTDGIEIRKSAGQVAVAMAKRADEQGKQLAAQAVELEKSAEQTKLVQLEKRADTDIKHFTKAIGPKVALLKAVDGIADDKVRGEVVEMLKAADAAMRELSVAKGANPESETADGETPLAKFNAGLVAFAKSKNKTEVAATADYLRTPEGASLYQAAQPSSTHGA